jgi:hypothetical protein
MASALIWRPIQRVKEHPQRVSHLEMRRITTTVVNGDSQRTTSDCRNPRQLLLERKYSRSSTDVVLYARTLG